MPSASRVKDRVSAERIPDRAGRRHRGCCRVEMLHGLSGMIHQVYFLGGVTKVSVSVSRAFYDHARVVDSRWHPGNVERRAIVGDSREL